jgi:FkbM family methyltransferase
MLKTLRTHLPMRARRVIRRNCTRLLTKSSYVLTRKPDVLLSNPDAEFGISFEFVVCHFLQQVHNPVFLQIGACDGRYADPLYQFITQHHWVGAVVEPQRDVFKALCETYRHESQLQFVNAAVAETNGTKKIYRVASDSAAFDGLGKALASFDRDIIISHRGVIPNIENVIEGEDVECMTLDSLLECLGYENVDILQIDTEGHDAIIVRMIDFEKLTPAIIHFEHKHLKQEDFDDCVELLVENGYRIGIGLIDTVAYNGQFRR